MWSLETGDHVKLTVPQNRFALSWRAPSYLLVAGGIGITPIYGMALALAARGADVRLVYAAKTRRQLAFASELKAALGDKVAFYVGEDGDRMNLANEIAQLSEDGETYVCGPLRLLAEAQALWAESGRPTSRLRYEVFGGLGDQPELPFSVQVADRDVVIDVASGQSMLDALTAAGVDMVWECRRGECGLCAVDLVDVDGEIDHRDVYLSADEKRRNTRMCPCVSRVIRGQATIDTGYRPS
jgi:vanillate O-demethylase ferredoxin subunit